MSTEFRKNLLGPEPTLLPAEQEVDAGLAAGDGAVDLAEEAWAERRTIVP